MNLLVSLTIIYGLMTLGSAGVLYLSFRGKLDRSGKYFLFAELQTLVALAFVFLVNSNEGYEQPLILGLTNFLAISSELAIFCSIYCLTKTVRIKHYLLAILCVAVYCVLTETARALVSPKLPYLLFNLLSAALCFGTYYLCRPHLNTDLYNNPFLKWIGRLEFALGCFTILRLLSFFSDEPIAPRHPTILLMLLYAIFVALSIFRYISYMSLRISWVDPRSQAPNRLNRNLAKALEERDQLVRGLMTSNRMLGLSALASSLVHQLSQPLTGISLQAEAIKRKLSQTEQNESAITSIDKISLQLGKLSELVTNLRKLFSADHDQFESLRLQQLSDEMIEIMELTLKNKKIHFEKNYLANPVVWGDAIQIQQVLINMFNNAIDALTSSNLEPKEIKLVINQQEGFAILSIADTGTGIDPAILPTMFELYQTTKQTGLGVGLWLSKTIIQKHNGTMTASNGTPHGAIFEIRLPLAPGVQA
jgi:signal transduction histidine kinase